MRLPSLKYTTYIIGAICVSGIILFLYRHNMADLTGYSASADKADNIAKITSILETKHLEKILVDDIAKFQIATNRKHSTKISWKDAEDKVVRLSDHRGKVIMLSLWASWCAPCIRELPSINRLQANLGSNKFTVVALNVDRGGKMVALRIKKRLGLNHLNLYLDKDNAVPRTLNIKALPTTVLFDTQGRELGRLEATAEWDSEVATNLIKYFVNQLN